MKNQIILIHGGEAFDTQAQFYKYLKNREYDPFETTKTWRDWIGWALSTDYEMMAPVMPNKQFADYPAWAIWFEKLFPYLNDQKLILIGHSLGGLFAAKYLSENKFPKRIDQLHLVAPVFDAAGLTGESVGSFILDPAKLSNVEKQADTICIYHSTDDPMVPYEHSQKYLKHMSKAKPITFVDRGHFHQPAFIELLEKIYEL